MKAEKLSSKRRIITLAVITIVMYLCCMIGATWALFINDPKDGTIGINVTTGELDVDLTDEHDNSLVGQVLKFTRAGVAEEVYFEPGATYYTQGFKVKNAGDIPMNYRMFISEDEDLDIKAFNEAFEVWITTDRTQKTPAEKLTEFSGKLMPQTESDVFYLFVRMKTDADNDFQGEEYSGIGITVYAVQGNVNM